MADLDKLLQRVKSSVASYGGSDDENAESFFQSGNFNNDFKLTFEEFKGILKRHLWNISDDEVTQLFNYFDKGKNGTLRLREFTFGIKPPLSEKRRQIVEDAFKKIKKSEEDFITSDDPNTLKKFKPCYAVDTASYANGKLTKEEFMDYYQYYSMNYETDDDFAYGIKYDWKL